LESPENLELDSNHAPTWFVRLNQGCLALIALFSVILGLGRTLIGFSEAGVEGVMSIIVGLAVIVAGTLLCRMSFRKRTFHYLSKKWNSVLDFILW